MALDDRGRLAAAGLDVVRYLSPDNVARGTTYTVTVRRTDVLALIAEIERQYPGALDRSRQIVARS